MAENPGNSFFNKRLIFISITAVAVLLYIGISGFLCDGWIAAAILSFGMYIILWSYAIYSKDTLLQALLVMATVAGFMELIADSWLVAHTHKLFYTKGEPMLVDSPLYMPFSWAVIITQFSVITLRLREVKGVLAAIVVGAILGGILIPFFEHSAKGACWWYYSDWKHEFWNTPWFITAGEALIIAVLPITTWMVKKPLSIPAVVMGIVNGLWIWFSYFIFYRLFDL